MGDFEPKQAREWVEKYFGGIKASELPPPPDLSEPKQEKEKHASRVDALAKRPGLAVAYHMPERNTPEYYAMGLIDQILIEGIPDLRTVERDGRDNAWRNGDRGHHIRKTPNFASGIGAL